MIPHNPQLPTIDPTAYTAHSGYQAFKDLLREKGRYIAPDDPLSDFLEAAESNRSLLIEGDPDAGKTYFVKMLAKTCNQPFFRLQCNAANQIDGLLYRWDADSQQRFVNDLRAGGVPLNEARKQTWTRDFLVLGEVLGAFDYASATGTRPILLIDEIDKIEPTVEDSLLEILEEGTCYIPQLTPDCLVGMTNPGSPWPIVVLTSNNSRHQLSQPLRRRCVFTYMEKASAADEIRILRTQVPEVSSGLLLQSVRLIDEMRKGAVSARLIRKPGIGESIQFLRALCRKQIAFCTPKVLRQHMCYLVKEQNDRANLFDSLHQLYKCALNPSPLVDPFVCAAYPDEIQQFSAESQACLLFWQKNPQGGATS